MIILTSLPIKLQQGILRALISVLLFAWLVPVWSESAVAAAAWMQLGICSASNQDGDYSSQSPLKPAHQLQHCSYCSQLHSDPVLPQAQLNLLQPVIATARIKLGNSGRSVVARLSARAHLSRAPPALA